VLDPNFDPFEIMHELSANQVKLNQDHQKLSIAIQHLVMKVNEQQHIIDLLQKGLDAANKANEIILQGFLDDMQKHFKEQK